MANNEHDLEFLEFLQKLVASEENAEAEDQEYVNLDDEAEEKQNKEKTTKKNNPNRRIVSVKEAEKLVDKYILLGKESSCQEIAEYITDADNHVCGNPDEYHNLISSFLGIGDYFNALRICEYALARFPYSVDILANAIRAASDGGDPDVLEALLERAEQIDKNYWNWRLFLFSIRAYRIKMTQCAPDEMDKFYNKALALSKDYQEYIPYDERAYNQEAETLLMHNEVDEARRVLRHAIFDDIDIKGTEVKIIAPQCCVTLLNEILEDTDEYDFIIEVAQKGIQYTAQEQPSSKIGYFVYRSALAKDAKVVADNYRIKSDIEDALREYQCAYELNRDRSYAKTIEIRYAILAQNTKNPVTDMPLSK